MLGLITAVLAVLYLRHRFDPAAVAAKRAAAIAAIQASGLCGYLTNLRPSGSGYVFTAEPAALLPLLNRSSPLTSCAFLQGSLYLIHAKECGCSGFGDCKDYRTPNGAIGPGSLQVVFNRRTGQGYFDYDKWNPYQSWAHFAKHAEEL